MARVRSRNTEPETTLRKALWARGFRYRLNTDLPGSPDLVFVASKTALFVDGCFWHGCPRHYTLPVKNREFWQRKLARNISRDRKADQDLGMSGWTVIRIWEHEISENLDEVVERLAQLLNGTNQ